MRTAVFYLYFESESASNNLTFFVDRGVFQSSSVDFFFLINNFVCSVDIPDFKNVKVLKKENSFDLAAFRYGLDRIDIASYDRFIFLNSSCVGPFAPAYEAKTWVETFTSLINDHVKLVGPILEVPPDNFGADSLPRHSNVAQGRKHVPFLHTYAFATDRVGIQTLINYEALPQDSSASKDQMINRFERLVTAAILNEGFGVRSFLYQHQGKDFSNPEYWKPELWTDGQTTCPEVPGNYEGIDVAPFEIMFIKNLRGAHSHRGAHHSGISDVLAEYLNRYGKWGSAKWKQSAAPMIASKPVPPLRRLVRKIRSRVLEK